MINYKLLMLSNALIQMICCLWQLATITICNYEIKWKIWNWNQMKDMKLKSNERYEIEIKLNQETGNNCQ